MLVTHEKPDFDRTVVNRLLTILLTAVAWIIVTGAYAAETIAGTSASDPTSQGPAINTDYLNIKH